MSSDSSSSEAVVKQRTSLRRRKINVVRSSSSEQDEQPEQAAVATASSSAQTRTRLGGPYQNFRPDGSKTHMGRPRIRDKRTLPVCPGYLKFHLNRH